MDLLWPIIAITNFALVMAVYAELRGTFDDERLRVKEVANSRVAHQQLRS